MPIFRDLNIGRLVSGLVAGALLVGGTAGALDKIDAVASASYLRSAGVSTKPVWSTLKLPNAATQGDLFVGTSANTMGALAGVAVNQVLASGGVGVAPAYSANPTITTLTTLGKIQANVSAFANPNNAGTTASGGDKVVVYESATFRATLGMNGNGTYLQSTSASANDGISFWTGNSTATEAARISRDGNLTLGTGGVFGSSAAKCLVLSNTATAPTNSTDKAHLWAYDIAAGRASLAVRTEEPVNAGVIIPTHNWQIQVNGSTYAIPLLFVSTP